MSDMKYTVRENGSVNSEFDSLHRAIARMFREHRMIAATGKQDMWRFMNVVTRAL